MEHTLEKLATCSTWPSSLLGVGGDVKDLSESALIAKSYISVVFQQGALMDGTPCEIFEMNEGWARAQLPRSLLRAVEL